MLMTSFYILVNKNIQFWNSKINLFLHVRISGPYKDGVPWTASKISSKIITVADVAKYPNDVIACLSWVFPTGDRAVDPLFFFNEDDEEEG